jgi:hypothetical protein
MKAKVKKKSVNFMATGNTSTLFTNKQSGSNNNNNNNNNNKIDLSKNT